MSVKLAVTYYYSYHKFVFFLLKLDGRVYVSQEKTDLLYPILIL